MAEPQWSEHMIARAIAVQLLDKKCVVLVDNCNWTGHECDVLGVTVDLRIIDVEVKISRADLKADADKSKWWKHLGYQEAIDANLHTPGEARWDPWKHRTRREWPRKVWKHYYAMPKSIWKPELAESLGSSKSGILLLSEGQNDREPPVVVRCERRATPNRDAERLSPEHVMDVARLANLRMWDAYLREESARRDLQRFSGSRVAAAAPAGIPGDW
jgi:hypothetical protein